MKFRHKIEKVNINGLREFSVNYFLCDELLVGRGSGCLIRLDSRMVELSHAKVYTSGDTLVIEDLNSEGGTRVNDVLVDKQVIKHGDRVKIGEVVFTVFFDGTYWGFHEVREEKPQEDREALIKKQLSMLNLTNFYPRFSTFSMLLVAVIGLVAFVEPYTGVNKQLWSSGPIANNHKTLENDCKACHAKPFERVNDQQCLKCHRMSEHAPALKQVVAAHPNVNFACEDCHHEHTGKTGLVETRSALCLQCHATLNTLHPETKHPIINSVQQHPQFSVSIPQYAPDDSIASMKRVELDHTNDLFDTTRIKLNHKKHLVKDLRSPDGPKTLGCVDCHKFSADHRTIVPITYEADCASCHPLGFDDRLPSKTVPHGDNDTVFNYVYAEYAKLFLDAEEQGSRQAFVQRFRPGEAPQAVNPSLQFTRQFIDQESRKAEKELFTRTACFLCHQVRTLDSAAPGKSAYRVLKPNIPDSWMPAARFNHGAHQNQTCESCHGARDSSNTSDVLMPKLQVCQSCHQSPGKSGKVESECITCHSYHDQLLLKDMPGRGKVN